MRKQFNRMITPMSVIHKLFLICLCLFGSFSAWSQTGNTYVSRDAFYDSLEARARALSQRLADLSGTEPIPFERPPPTILSTRPPPPNPAQSAFDALPEQNPKPAASPLVPTVPETDDGTLYRADGTPVKIKEEAPEAPVKKGPPRKEMQRDRGQYFIQPFVGLSFISSDASLSYVSTFGGGSPIRSNVDLETKIGHAIGVSLGRRWDNLEGELHFSYATVGYDSADVTSPSSTFSEIGLPASGEVELFQIGARAGYGFPVGESGWIRAAGGFGYGKRRDFLSIRPLTSASRNYSSSESAFTYDLLFSLGYEIEWGLDAFLAYRLLGSSGNGDFDKVAMHLFELGLGANF